MCIGNIRKFWKVGNALQKNSFFYKPDSQNSVKQTSEIQKFAWEKIITPELISASMSLKQVTVMNNIQKNSHILI